MLKKVSLPSFAQPVKYAVVGLIGQATDYLLTVLLANAWVPIVAANSIGYISGSMLTYVGHAKYTFAGQSRGLRSPRQLMFFVLTCLLGAGIGSFMLILLTKAGISIETAKLVQLAIIALVQYLLNRFFTFQR